MTRRLMLVLCILFAVCRLSLAETGKCPAGTYRANNGSCINCTEGVGYTDIDDMDICLPCHDCESAGQVEVSPCKPTQNTKCKCKTGKRLKTESPEHCESDESLNKQPNGTGNVSPGDGLGLGLGFGLGGFFVILASCIIYHQKSNTSQALLDLRNSLGSFWARCRGYPRTASDIGQNDLNEKENLTEIESYDERQGHDGHLLDTVDLERELESQAQVPLPAETAQALGDPEQVPTGAGQSQERRRRLVPVEGTNGAETFRFFFNDIPNIVPIPCWKPLMRHLDLTDNEIYAAEKENSSLHEQMYKMLVTWQEKKGTGASVNTLLETLEAQGQRLSKEVIQDKLLKSGKFIYENDGAGSVVSHEDETMKPADLLLLS